MPRYKVTINHVNDDVKVSIDSATAAEASAFLRVQDGPDTHVSLTYEVEDLQGDVYAFLERQIESEK